MITIHTIGDSHCKYGFNAVKIPGIKIVIHHINSRLMYSVGRDGLDMLDLSYRGFNILPNDIVIVCYGEIDTRKGIRLHLKSLEDYKENINSIVYNYFKTLNKNIVKLPNLKVCIFNVVPPCKNAGIVENYTEEIDKYRLIYTLYMNDKLKKFCSSFKYKYIFFDVYKEYSNENGYFNESYTTDRLHISDPVFLTKFIKENLIKGLY